MTTHDSRAGSLLSLVVSVFLWGWNSPTAGAQTAETDPAEEVAEEEASDDTYDWDSLDEEASDDEFDWDSLDEEDDVEASDESGSDDEFDWDSLDEEDDAEDDYDWESVDSEDGAEEDWDDYWDAIDAQEEEAEDIEVPVEVAETSGGLEGVVIDDDLNEPVGGAQVSIVETDDELTTGPAGAFFFELEPGTYVVRVDHFELSGLSYEVLIEAGEITNIGNVRMRPANNLATIVVEGRAVQESTAQQLRERQDSTTVQDAVSAEQISEAGDSSAGSAVQRVVGVTLIDDRFLAVRGLGGRYTDVTLNGIPVPLTDPDYPSAEVDIFPTELLSGLTLSKNPTANLRTFTGGLMDVTTRAYPEELELALSVSVSGDTNTTFQRFESDPLGSADALGFDTGARQWPDMPSDESLDYRVQDNYESIARGFPTSWESSAGTARPNLGLKLNVGNTLEVGERRLGYLLMAGYSNGFSHASATRSRVEVDEDGGVAAREELDVERYDMKTTWGTLGNLALDLNNGHSLRLMTMWSHNGRERFEFVDGVSDEEGADLERSQLQWLQRTMVFNQLSGSHRRLLPETSPFHETRIDWRAGLSLANREEPDTRYFKTLNGVWDENPGSGEHFRSDLSQTDIFGGLDLEVPHLDNVTMQVGGSASRVARTFDTRRVRFTTSRTAEFPDGFSELPPNELFADEFVRADGGPLRLAEFPNVGDSFSAEQRSLAGYASVEVAPVERLRLTGGARYESFAQDLRDVPLVGEPDEDASVRRVDNDVMGSGAVIVELRESMFLRAVYGGSVARPQMREIAPFRSQDYVRRRVQTGNPDLLRTYVHNADLRWEWFPSATEVLAASVFYKSFRHPIEATLVNRQGDVLFLNADGSANYGVELEAQLDLGRIGPRAEGLSLGANLAIVDSEIRLPCTRPDSGDGCLEQYTNSDRPMEGQAPWQVNARFGWDSPTTGFSFATLYRALGPTLSDVGTNGLPDSYKQPQHLVDLTARYALGEHWGIGLKLRNLLLQPERETQGAATTYREHTPLSFGLSVGWDH